MREDLVNVKRLCAALVKAHRRLVRQVEDLSAPAAAASTAAAAPYPASADAVLRALRAEQEARDKDVLEALEEWQDAVVRQVRGEMEAMKARMRQHEEETERRLAALELRDRQPAAPAPPALVFRAVEDLPAAAVDAAADPPVVSPPASSAKGSAATSPLSSPSPAATVATSSFSSSSTAAAVSPASSDGQAARLRGDPAALQAPGGGPRDGDVPVDEEDLFAELVRWHGRAGSGRGRASHRRGWERDEWDDLSLLPPDREGSGIGGGGAEDARWSPVPWGAAPPPGGRRLTSSAPWRGPRRRSSAASRPLFGLARAAVSAAASCGSGSRSFPPGTLLEQREEP
jgi:hypothetical protein